jgi:hypothetical protein
VNATRALVLAASGFHCVLAGGGLDRAFVQMPAWRRVGPLAWAEFSRNADLRDGLVLYPVAALGGAACSILAAATAPPRKTASLWAGAILSLLGLLATTRAAPRMLSLRNLSNEQIGPIATAFDGFRRWGNVRMVVQVGAFVANLWALARTP